MDADDLTSRAKRLVDEVLKPLIAKDGGVLELVSVTSDRLVVRLTGSYGGCPGTPYALRGVIEPAAKKTLGATIRVELAGP